MLPYVSNFIYNQHKIQTSELWQISTKIIYSQSKLAVTVSGTVNNNETHIYSLTNKGEYNHETTLTGENSLKSKSIDLYYTLNSPEQL